MIIYPSDEKLADEFNVNPAEFKKQVKALSNAAKNLSDMGFYIFGGNSSGRLATKEDIVLVELDGDYDGGAGDDLVVFESKD